ncbi:hypothetical protein K7432_002265 [Basidiobolus ranarum]|uniref:BZIP domain-containing protein n=1 Tax=Basidiobolus ranarum TaxID=34480 RepID=A0ABR2W851_9FUNG
MTEQLSSNPNPYYTTHSSHGWKEDQSNSTHPSSPDFQQRKVASRRRKAQNPSIDNPASPRVQPPFPHNTSPHLPILPPPIATSYQNPMPNTVIMSPASILDQSSSPTDPLPFTRPMSHIHLPSPDMLQLRHSVPPAIPVFPSMANMSSSLPSSSFATSALPAYSLSNSFPPTSMSELSPSPGADNDEGFSSYAQSEAMNEETAHIQVRSGVLKSLTSDERKQRRLLRNRLAAKECRKKKKAYVIELEDKVQQLEGENSQLKSEIQQLNTKLNSSTW